MMYRSRMWVVCWLFIVLSSTVYGQNILQPAQHGGDLNRSIDLRDPQAGTLRKTPVYVFDKQNPRHRSAIPLVRSCHTQESEADLHVLSPGGTESDSSFEFWMQQSIQQQQRSRGFFRFGPEELLTIPTVVHVIYASPIENISDAQVLSQIQVLNQDYRRQNPDQVATPREYRNIAVDTGIEFCLANLDPQGRPTNGIHRVSFGGAPFTERYLNEVIKPATSWDPNRYFNIWVCHLADNVLGFAQFPVSSGLSGVPSQRSSAATDGVVIHYSVFGTTGTVSPPFNRGRTATHEVGHWLGLRHVWGDGPCGVDDFCGDTPETAGPHYGCPPGSMGCQNVNAMIQNYMDYSDDGCMNLFTQDQKTRMRLVLQNSPRRGSLLTSRVCVPPLVPPIPAFAANVRQGCGPLRVSFQDRSEGKELSLQWTFPGASPSSSDKPNPSVVYRNPGVYPVSLRVTNAAGTRAITTEQYITVTAAGLGLPYDITLESGSPLPPTGFSFRNPDNDYTWAISERVGARGQSRRSLSINNFDNKLVHSADWLLLPVMNFTGETAPVLSFDLAYGAYGGQFSDTLGVFVSTGCGTLFRSIYYKGGEQLATVDRAVRVPFTPEEESWRTEQIDLRFLVGEPNVEIAFINFSGNGNDIYLDNIRLGAPLPLPPVPAFTASAQEICAGEFVEFRSTTPGASLEHIWSFPGATPASVVGTTPRVKYETAGKYDVILTVRGPGGERTVTRQAVLQVNGAPKLQIEGQRDICQGETLRLRASGAEQYEWMVGEERVQRGSQAELTFEPKADNVLLVIGEGAGCVSQQSLPIRVKRVRPLVITPATAEICAGEQLVLQATGATRYRWSAASIAAEASSGNLAVSPTQTTSYRVEGVTDDGCTLRAEATITVRESPTALDIVAPRLRICPGESVELQARGADAYRWSPTVGLNKSDGAEVLASPDVSTTYRIEGTNAFGCRNSRELRIEVIPFPEVQIRSLTPRICAGTSVTLQARGALRYDWLPHQLVQGQGAEVQAAPDQDQVFTVIGLNEAGCSDTAQVLVQVVQPEPIQIFASEPVVCPGAATTLSASGANDYRWVSSQSLSGSTGPSVIARPRSQETYRVTGRDRQGCMSSASVTIQVAAGGSPTADFRAEKTLTCAGEAVQFSSLSRHAVGFRWEFEGGEPAFSSEANPSIRFPREGSFTVRLEVLGCDRRTDRQERYNYLFITKPATISLNTADRVVCRGEQISMLASGLRTYEWSPSIGLDRAEGPSVMAMPLSTTTYTVKGIDQDGCTSTKKVTLEVVTPQEVVIFPAKASICKGDSVRLIARGALDYRWAAPGVASVGQASEIVVRPSKTMTYSLQAVDLNGCTYRREVVVEVADSLSLKLSADKMTICEGERVKLLATGAPVVNWRPAGFLSTATGSDIDAFPLQTTTFYAVGTSETGCRAEGAITLTVNPVSPVTVKAQDSVICPGQGTLLTATGGVNFTWSPATGLNQVRGPLVTAAPAQTTTYTVMRDGGACGASTQITVEVKAPEPLLLSPTTAKICRGDEVRLGVSGGTRYVWELAEGLSTIAGAEVRVKPSVTTQYVVRSLDTRNCELLGTATVVVSSSDFMEAASSASTVCAGEEVTLTASGAVSYVWAPEPSLLSDSGARVYAQPTIGTIYQVMGENEEGCRDTATVEVRVREFEADFLIQPDRIDLADGPGLVQFSGEIEGAKEYAWKFGERGSASDANPLHVFTQPGNHAIQFAASDGICVSRTEGVLVVENSSSIEEILDQGDIRLESAGNGMFRLTFRSPRKMYLRLRLLDASGTELLSGAIRPGPGPYAQDFDLRSYPVGEYYLRLSDGEMTETLAWKR